MLQLKKTSHRGRIIGSWTEESMKEAIREVRKGNNSIRKIGDRYKIPASSIRDWMSGKTSSKKKGPRTILSKEEEDTIVEWCLANQKMRSGITFYMLRKKVVDVCHGRETPFKDGVPGKRWLEWFRKRHPSVVIEPAHALKGKKRPESEREVLAAKGKQLSPPQLLMDSNKDILAIKFANRSILGSALDSISGLEDQETHTILTQTLTKFHEDDRELVCAPNMMKGHEDNLKSSFSGESDNCTVCTLSYTNEEMTKISIRHAENFKVHMRNNNLKHERDVNPNDQNIELEGIKSCTVEALGCIV